VVEHAGTAEALRAAATARFILNEALSHGVKVGAALDGSDLVMLAPRHMPRDVARWFENKLAEFREECIAVIQADVAARAGGQSS
jgi:hypothetical protein